MSVALGNVHRKISCIFKVVVLPNATSSKRNDQSYRVVATDIVQEKAATALLDSRCNSGNPDINCCHFIATEKLDGTLVLVNEFSGKPWIWARHDKKPNKAAEKRFKKFQNEHPQSLIAAEGEEVNDLQFHWNVDSDFKEVPAQWIPAQDSFTEDGRLLTGANGHIFGWVPVDPKSKQHCWHLSTVDLDSGVGLVLLRKSDHLEIALQSLSELSGCTMELIGTNVNGNPYRLGSKSKPLHLLVRHGIIPAENVPLPNSVDLADWFCGSDGGVEGIVWHLDDGSMYKLHRDHLNLQWPVADLKLLTFPVLVNVEGIDPTACSSRLISDLIKISGQRFDSLDRIKFD